MYEFPYLINFGLLSTHLIIQTRVVSYLTFIISHLQLLFVLTKTTLQSLHLTETIFGETLQRLYQLIGFDISHLTESSAIFALIVLMVAAIYLIVVSSLVATLLIITYQDKAAFPCIIRLWNIAVYLHPLIIFYPIHNTTLQLLSYLIQGMDAGLLSAMEHQIVKYTCVVVLGFNIAFNFASLAYFSINIQTKDKLSTKTKFIHNLDFALKLVLPVLWISKAKLLNPISFGYIPLLYQRLGIFQIFTILQHNYTQALRMLPCDPIITYFSRNIHKIRDLFKLN